MLSQPALWDRVRGFDLDTTGGQSFVLRLIHRTGWDEPFALAAIEEYRRFLYLTEISFTETRMSEPLWQVWSFHRHEAEGNWTVFDSTLSGDPARYARLRPAETSPLDAQTYDCTRALYLREFGARRPMRCGPT